MRVAKILYSTDFSAASHAALPGALFFAERFDAELVFQHVLVFRTGDLFAPEAHFPEPEELFEKLRAIAHSQLGDLLRQAPDRPLRLRQVIDRDADEVSGILARARVEQADLLVLGSHGRRGAAHLLLGSVVADVLRRAPCPVLTLRTGAGARPFTSLRRILAADDFSTPARRALEHGAALAALAGARLDLAHVLESPEMPVPPGPVPVSWGATFVEDLEPAARAGLADDRSRHAPGSVGEDLILRGRGALGLIERAEGTDTDLVVQGTAGRTGLDRILLGSFAERVARLAPCAVLTVPAHARTLV